MKCSRMTFSIRPKFFGSAAFTRSHSDSNWPDAPEDTFCAIGHEGDRALVVIPSLDLVAAWSGGMLSERTGNPMNEALNILVRAVLEDFAGSRF